MKHSDRVYLLHILDAIETIQVYLLGIREEDFRRHKLIQDGVIRQLTFGQPTDHHSRESGTGFHAPPSRTDA